MRRMPPSLLAATLALASFTRPPPLLAQDHSASPAVAADRCVDPDVARAAVACPSHLVHGLAPVSAAPPRAHAPVAAAPHAAPGLTVRPQTLMHPPAQAAQIQTMTEREVGLLMQLANQQPASDPHHADTLLRLGNTLTDLAQHADDEAYAMDERIFAARHASSGPAAVGALERTQAEQRARARRDRQLAAQTYERLLTEAPHYAQADAVMSALAFTYHQLDDEGSARRTYLTLIQRFPQSSYVIQAYLVFGEYFFGQNDLASSRQFYDRVVAAGPRDNPSYGYALYRLAWVAYNQQQFDDSLAMFFRVIDHARQDGASALSASLLRTARLELVQAYGALYGVSRPLRAGDALALFRRYAADTANADEMLERLGEIYQDAGQWPNGIAVYHQLMAAHPDSARMCLWQAQVTRAVVASRGREDQMTEIQRLFDVYAALHTTAHETVTACRDAVGRLAYDVASHWHLEVMGQGTAGEAQGVGTRDPRTMARASQVYAWILARLPDFDAITFPDYDRSDWPTRYRLAFYQAELTRARGDHCACGAAFDRVVDLDPTGPLTEDASYKAVLCYNACVAGHPSGGMASASTGALDPRPFNPDEAAMNRAFTRYLCVADAEASAAPSVQTDQLMIAYRRAYLFYAANRFEEAATLLHDVATGDPAVPDPEHLREVAANLYLDTLNVLATRVAHPRTACLATLSNEAAFLSARWCGADTRAAHAEVCDGIADVQCGTLRLQAESLHHLRHFREAGALYVRIVHEHTECPRPDELLANAAIEFDAANMLGRAMRVRERLIDVFLPRESVHAIRALHRLAENDHAIQVFSRASELYEQFATYVHDHPVPSRAADPDAEAHAADALRQATVFRIGLGDETQALADAQTFARFFGTDPARRRTAASVVFAIGQIHQHRAERAAAQPAHTDAERVHRDGLVRAAWGEVARHYERYLAAYASHGTIDQRVVGLTATGRAYAALGDAPRAHRAFDDAVRAWGADGGRANEAQLHTQLGEEADGAIEHARDAVAEARFLLGEAEYRRFMARPLVVYHGGASTEAFQSWETQTMVPYVVRQRRTLESLVTQSYRPVIDMGVPNWQIAAAARAGEAFHRFASLLQDAPIPPDIEHDNDLLAEYLRRRAEVVGQFDEAARGGLEQCIERSTRLHWFNEWSQLCERTMNAIDPHRYPLADELHVLPTLSVVRPAPARPVYQLDDATEGN